MRVAIYKRVSTEEQVDGSSLQTQERDCRAFVEQRGWIVTEVYSDEGVSGRKVRRPALDRLLADARKRHFDAVIVWKLDRFARHTRFQLEICEELDRLKIDLHSATEGTIDFGSAHGHLSLTVQAEMAQVYSMLLSARMKRAIRYKAEQGLWVGPAPTGYTVSRGVLTPRENLPAVVLAFESYLTGLHSDMTLADLLNSEGWRTNSGALFGRENIRLILHNKGYAGFVQCGGIWMPGKHAPIITLEMWEDVQTLRRKRMKNGGVSASRDGGLLSELAHCAHCKKAMWSHWSGRESSPRHYYRCSGNYHRTCLVRMAVASAVEPALKAYVAQLAIPESLIDEVLARAEEIRSGRAAVPAIDRQRLEDDMRRLGIAYANGAFGDGTAADAEYRRRLESLRGLLRQAPESTPQWRDLRKSAWMLSQLPYMLERATEELWRTLMRQLFQRVWLDKREVKAITPTAVFEPLIGAIVTSTLGCGSGVANGAKIEPSHIHPGRFPTVQPVLWTVDGHPLPAPSGRRYDPPTSP